MPLDRTLLPPHDCADPACQWKGFRAKAGYYIARWLATHPPVAGPEDAPPKETP